MHNNKVKKKMNKRETIKIKKLLIINDKPRYRASVHKLLFHHFHWLDAFYVVLFSHLYFGCAPAALNFSSRSSRSCSIALRKYFLSVRNAEQENIIQVSIKLISDFFQTPREIPARQFGLINSFRLGISSSSAKNYPRIIYKPHVFLLVASEKKT